jgi:hypothetical protein
MVTDSAVGRNTKHVQAVSSLAYQSIKKEKCGKLMVNPETKHPKCVGLWLSHGFFLTPNWG